VKRLALLLSLVATPVAAQQIGNVQAIDAASAPAAGSSCLSSGGTPSRAGWLIRESGVHRVCIGGTWTDLDLGGGSGGSGLTGVVMASSIAAGSGDPGDCYAGWHTAFAPGRLVLLDGDSCFAGGVTISQDDMALVCLPGAVIDQSSSTTTDAVTITGDGVTLRGCTINSNAGEASQSKGIYVDGESGDTVTGLLIERVTIADAGTNAIQADYAPAAVFRHVTITGAQQHAILVNDSDDVLMERIHVDGAIEHAIADNDTNGQAALKGIRSSRGRITDSTVLRSYGNGMEVAGPETDNSLPYGWVMSNVTVDYTGIDDAERWAGECFPALAESHKVSSARCVRPTGSCFLGFGVGSYECHNCECIDPWNSASTGSACFYAEATTRYSAGGGEAPWCDDGEGQECALSMRIVGGSCKNSDYTDETTACPTVGTKGIPCATHGVRAVSYEACVGGDDDGRNCDDDGDCVGGGTCSGLTRVNLSVSGLDASGSSTGKAVALFEEEPTNTVGGISYSPGLGIVEAFPHCTDDASACTHDDDCTPPATCSRQPSIGRSLDAGDAVTWLTPGFGQNGNRSAWIGANLGSPPAPRVFGFDAALDGWIARTDGSTSSDQWSGWTSDERFRITDGYADGASMHVPSDYTRSAFVGERNNTTGGTWAIPDGAFSAGWAVSTPTKAADGGWAYLAADSGHSGQGMFSITSNGEQKLRVWDDDFLFTGVGISVQSQRTDGMVARYDDLDTADSATAGRYGFGMSADPSSFWLGELNSSWTLQNQRIVVESGGTANQLVLDGLANGRVGIGLANPTAKLEINSDGLLHALGIQKAGLDTYTLSYPGGGLFCLRNHTDGRSEACWNTGGDLALGGNVSIPGASTLTFDGTDDCTLSWNDTDDVLELTCPLRAGTSSADGERRFEASCNTPGNEPAPPADSCVLYCVDDTGSFTYWLHCDGESAVQLDSPASLAEDSVTTTHLDDAADTPVTGECLKVGATTTQIEYGACSTLTTDSVTLGELDDDANTPVEGYLVTVEAGLTSVRYTDPATFAAASHEHAASDVTSGTLAHERGGLEADVSGYTNGLYCQLSGATADCDSEAELETALGGIDVVAVATDDISSANLRTALSDEVGTGAAVFEGGAPTLTGTNITGIPAGAYSAAGIDGDDINSNLAGAHLTLNAGSPDTLDVDAELKTDQGCVVVLNPSTGAEFYTIWRAPVAVTLTELYCEVTGGTSVLADLEIDDGTPTGVNGSDLTCSTSGVTDSSLAGDVTMAAGDRLDLDLGTVSGSVTQMSFCWKVTIDD